MIRKSIVFFIKIYKITISPFLPRACIYNPSCSEYSALAISKFGIIKGGIFSALRILKCNPFSKGGYDPVP